MPADDDSLDVFLLPMTASIATTATKECIVSTDDAELEADVEPVVPIPDDAEVEPDVEPVDTIPACTHECNSAVVLDVKPLGKPLKGKNVESGVVREHEYNSGVVLDVKPVGKPLKGKNVESGVVLDVKPVDQPLKGKNDLEIAFAKGFLNG